jgi:protein dithiol oxidoreductase (disulfide-forming)
MGGRYSAWCLALALALTGCGKQQSVDQHAPGNGPAAASAPGAAVTPRSDAAGQKPAEQASDQPSKITRMNEDGSETVEDVPSDSGVHNPLLAAVASTIAASTSTASAAAAVSGSWQEGVNYTRLVPAQPTAVAAGQVEVLEFFWYACPHCYGMDPLVESWKRTKPAYVSFSRVHVMWNEGHRSLARLYYTVESMGKLDQLHGEIFREIHVNGNALVAANPNNQAETERIQSAFVRRFGISESDFKSAYHSMSVDLALQRADELVERYRVGRHA